AWLPGRSRVNKEALAAGTGIMNEARPASMVNADATESDTANGAGPLRIAVCREPSNNKGKALLACLASSRVNPVVSGTLTNPLSRTLPAISTVPVNDESSTRSLNAAVDSTYGSGAASLHFGFWAANSVRRLNSAKESVTVPVEVGAGTGTSLRAFRICAYV